AGVLDAWVTPSGELLDPETRDIVLAAAASPLPPEDAHLGTIVVPCNAPTDSAGEVPAYVVSDILMPIGTKPEVGYTCMSWDGRWQNGPLTGRWSKPAAEYIGTAAREQARWKRILELDAAIAEIQARIDSLKRSTDELYRREYAARTETESAPPVDV